MLQDTREYTAYIVLACIIDKNFHFSEEVLYFMYQCERGKGCAIDTTALI